MEYGTGPVKGFAVTLFIGILCSLFTGFFCTRVVFDWWVRGAKVKRLSVGAEF
jgi:preprotein translocase subunit SecD